MAELTVGSQVAYSVQFLKSIGMPHSHMAHARGTVTGIKFLGTLVLARLDWNGADLPEQVNVHNLALVGLNRKFCNVD
jgi:hypothetical protein